MFALGCAMGKKIQLKGVKTHNLKGLDVAFPLGALTVVTGVSGSGKSSLVFDSLYAESYGRYVESLSSFARQYLRGLSRPELSDVLDLPASVAIKQKRTTQNPRSTVGTLSEVTDLLRVIFAHAGISHCQNGHGPLSSHPPEKLFDKLLEENPGQRVTLLAPLKSFASMKQSQLKKQLEIQGFVRIYRDGKVQRLEDAKAKGLFEHSVVIDRVKVTGEEKARLIGSLALAYKVGRGKLTLLIGEDKKQQPYYKNDTCRECGQPGVKKSPILFNHNHPLGACKTCQGFGRIPQLDRKKLIPDRSLSLAEEGVKCWHFGRHGVYLKAALKSAKACGIDVDAAFETYGEEQWQWLLNGKKGTGFTGIEGYFAYLDRKKYKAHYRMHAARFRTYVSCTACHGQRLNPAALSVRFEDLDFGKMGELPLESVLEKLSRFSLAKTHNKKNADVFHGLQDALEEASVRLGYLCDVGVSYLSLNRPARSLSGGEMGRIQMARCLGNNLTGTLFCLDEPTSGLHIRDSLRLKKVMDKIKAQGNTLVVVEHESSIIASCDHLIELGPKAGKEGGQLIYEGPPRALPSFSGLPPKAAEKKRGHTFLQLKGATIHNLKGIDTKFPLGALTCVFGVSGSGKSSLVSQTLYPRLKEALSGATDTEEDGGSGRVGPASAIESISQVLVVGQEGLQRSSRSNIATYLGIYAEIRKIYSQLPKAKAMGLKPGHFSFNVSGGRCETCKGLGNVLEDMSFLGEILVTCPDCEGRRFSEEVLSVRYKKRNLLDILALTVTDARELFFDRPTLVKVLDEIIEIGLGYLTLGQSTSSFSGGEAQRLKLLGLMKDIKKDGPYFLIIDEPTTGLSDYDVKVLLAQLQTLCSKGHTIVVVEHHLGVIQSADWLIEIGPEAGEAGGELVYMGPLSGYSVAGAERSITAPFIEKALEVEGEQA